MARNALEVSGLHAIFGVERSQVSRWTKNPEIYDDAQRNPIDKVKTLFSRMVDAGESAAVAAMVVDLSEPLGCHVEMQSPAVPEHESVQDELLDIHPACAEHAQAIRSGGDMRAVEHWEREAIKQIQQATEAFRLKFGDGK